MEPISEHLDCPDVAFREHPSKVVRLVRGELVGYPPAAAENCTLWVPLSEGPDEWEGLLGRRISEDAVEVVGIPVFAYDLNLGDVVRVLASAEGALVASERLTETGNYTFRVWFEHEPRAGEHWNRLMTDLEPFGCWFDTWSEKLIAISATANDAQSVADYLRGRESASELTYETGRSK